MSRMIIRLRQSTPVFAITLFVQVVFTTVVCASDKQSEGMALIRRAVDLTDLRQSGPYHMRSSLTVVDEALGKREGTDVVTFLSTERRRDLHMAGYDEVAVFLGHNMYRTRSLGFTPPSLRVDIAGSLRNLPETLTYKVLRVFNRKINEVEARRVYLQQQNDQPAEVTWCFDPTTGLPIKQLSGNGRQRIKFSNYKPFGSRFVPGVIEAIVDGKQRGKAVIEAIDSGITDSVHVFEPPVDATVRQWCDNMQRPRPISIWPPDIPPGARSHSGLELKYELTVDAQGNVMDVIPMAAKPYVDRIAIETIRRWQSKPAMCDGTPVPTDMWIDIAAMMHQ
jgi:hypothetical protein